MNGWYTIKPLSPGFGRRVLIWNGRYVGIATREKMGALKSKWRTDGHSRVQYVTHWQPLPDAPESRVKGGGGT